MIHAYLRVLKQHPYKTNMISAGVLFGAGDALAQHFFPSHDNKDQRFSYNFPRTMRAMIYGSFFLAPVSVAWHIKRLPFILNPLVKSSFREVPKNAKKVYIYDNLFRLAIDQFFGPILVWIPMYNIVMTFLNPEFDNKWETAKEKLSNNFTKVLFANWTVWPIFQIFNLFFVPVHLRLLCSNFWSVGWNCFLSFVHNTKGHGTGSGHIIEEIVDLENEEDQRQIIYQ